MNKTEGDRKSWHLVRAALQANSVTRNMRFIRVLTSPLRFPSIHRTAVHMSKCAFCLFVEMKNYGEFMRDFYAGIDFELKFDQSDLFICLDHKLNHNPEIAIEMWSFCFLYFFIVRSGQHNGNATVIRSYHTGNTHHAWALSEQYCEPSTSLHAFVTHTVLLFAEANTDTCFQFVVDIFTSIRTSQANI